MKRKSKSEFNMTLDMMESLGWVESRYRLDGILEYKLTQRGKNEMIYPERKLNKKD